ncbi:hypothetical protein BC936DRAFT_148766 [Jimgerdemannia flammicorona]|uniref:Exonuclease domain-containing protein n=1 Tax=Jimgerdemannia flammicorona TaxID=994334 RepID=A0A433DKJ8_9FUNG|nr:hypothetical protein BC936DRAFT_148766 [Jimgerdemannia flammicorona]
MFASLGHFTKQPCPFLPDCNRVYCHFSHIPQPPPAKRRKTENYAPQHLPFHSSTQPTSPARMTRPAAAGISGTPSTPSATGARAGQRAASHPTTSPARTPQKSTVSSARPPQNLIPTGPPVVPPDVRSHSPAKLRQLIATKFHAEFVRIYTPHALASDLTLATVHALRQESAVHAASGPATYKNLAANTLTRLKRRAPACDALDIGIDGEYLPPGASPAEGTGPDLGNAATYPVRAQNAARYVLTVAQMEQMGYPIQVTDVATVERAEEDEGKIKPCDRCGREYTVKAVLREGDLVACVYHHGKIRVVKVDGQKQRSYSCCDKLPGDVGCTSGPHVFKEETIAELERRAPFVQAPPASSRAARGVAQVRDLVALDCEMCYTTAGLELARLTVLDGRDGAAVLDELVLPRGGAVIDLNTRFSGIVTLRDAKYDFKGIMEKFFEFVDGGTIIVGQSLLYPHSGGLPYRHSLRNLAHRYLKKFIQDSAEGHDSAEDARACLELLALKIRKGPDFGIINTAVAV